MTSLNDLRITLERDYLEPIVERTPQAPLTVGISDSELTMTVTDGIFSPDEESVIGPGAILELEEELIFVTDYNQNTQTITMVRGFDGSVAVAHAVSTMVRIPTRWTRYSQIAALRESLEALFPPLYSPEQERGTVDTMRYLQLPLATVNTIRVRWDNSGRWVDCQAELFDTHPLDDNFAAIQLEEGVPTGALCMVRYGLRPTVPANSTDEIDGYREKWTRLIVVDAAVRLMSGVDIDAVTQEYLTEQIRLERFPVRSGSSITQSLIGYREYLLEQALTDLISNDPLPTHMASVEYYG